jgi:hypothetical protein
MGVTRVMRVSTAVGVCLALAGVARADPRLEATALFEQGIQDLNAGRTEQACKEFAASLARWEDMSTKGMLAKCDTKLGRIASAWLLWKDLVDTEKDEDFRIDAKKNAAELEPRLPRFVVQLTGPAPAGLVITVNGSPADPTLGVALPIDPGAVVAVASAPDRQPWSATFQAVEAQQLTIAVPKLLEIARVEVKPAAPPAPAPAPAPVVVAVAPPSASIRIEAPVAPPPPPEPDLPMPTSFSDTRLALFTGLSGNYSGTDSGTSSVPSGGVGSMWMVRVDHAWSNAMPGIMWVAGLGFDVMDSDLVHASSSLYSGAATAGIGYVIGVTPRIQVELVPYIEFVAVAIDHPFSSAEAWGNGGGVGARFSVVYTARSGLQVGVTGGYSYRFFHLAGTCSDCPIMPYDSDTSLSAASLGVSIGRRSK